MLAERRFQSVEAARANTNDDALRLVIALINEEAQPRVETAMPLVLLRAARSQTSAACGEDRNGDDKAEAEPRAPGRDSGHVSSGSSRFTRQTGSLRQNG